MTLHYCIIALSMSRVGNQGREATPIRQHTPKLHFCYVTMTARMQDAAEAHINNVV